MYSEMDGWINRKIIFRWIVELINGYKEGQKWMNKWIDEWIGRYVDKWINER